MKTSRTSLMMLAVGSVLLSASSTSAQQPSRRALMQFGHHSQARPVAHCDTGHCLPANTCDGWGTGCGCGSDCRCGSNCRCGSHGRCGSNCTCGNGRGRAGCSHWRAAGINGGACGYGCNPHYSHCGIGCLLNKINPYHVCTYPPDHGWAPPAQRPIWPASAAYRRNFPAAWTGEDLGIDPAFRYPMVYMPTDTTQLGYYYQHTPFWRARQNMIPPVPNPAEWHTPDFGVEFTGWEDGQGYANYECPQGTNVYDGASARPIPGPGPDQEADPQADPVPMMESNPPAPYSPAPNAPVNPPDAPPAPEEAAPAPTASTGAGRSAALPKLVPVPQR